MPLLAGSAPVVPFDFDVRVPQPFLFCISHWGHREQFGSDRGRKGILVDSRPPMMVTGTSLETSPLALRDSRGLIGQLCSSELNRGRTHFMIKCIEYISSRMMLQVIKRKSIQSTATTSESICFRLTEIIFSTMRAFKVSGIHMSGHMLPTK
ncbi:uncharacterized protein LOC143215672 [Lasioglossum baleicum]|uniref:uncharacterized protein LOC143215672 n=1 Tax=Lasioglossum baleicum TaxID=434251 RepID=UPI003FCEB9E2